MHPRRVYRAAAISPGGVWRYQRTNMATIAAVDFPRGGPMTGGADERRRKLKFTDIDAKVEELLNNKAALHVWIRKSMLQLRLEVCFDILTGLDVATVVRPPASRISYSTLIPGQPIGTVRL